MTNADFIIIGAGTAGCVLAGELSTSHRVLLLEAGGAPHSPFVKIPAGFAKLFKSKYDWNFETAPQTALDGKRIYTPRGKMLGGSSNLNAQIHQWRLACDFDEWAVPGWAWNDVAPAFPEMERTFEGEEGRGRDGPMRIARNVNAHPAAQAFVDAVGACGVAARDGHEGAWIVETAHDRGARFSAYDAYLKPAMARDALQVRTKALARRILFKDGRAIGVEIQSARGVEILHAGKGVICAAGALMTPAILMRSGLGPAEALRALGVDVIADRGDIGAHLQDHPMAPAIFSTARKDTLKSAETPANLLKYILHRRGPLASNVAEAIAFARSRDDLPAPDIELLFAPVEWRDEGLTPPKAHAFTIASIVVAPRSMGSVGLKDARAETAPIIDFGLFTDPAGADKAAMLAGFRLARRVAQSAALRPYFKAETAPGADHVSDEALWAAVKPRMQTLYHPTSTCRMGADAAAPVDPHLRVRGVENVWVADASVLPRAPRGHPNALVAMVARRAAAFINAA